MQPERLSSLNAKTQSFSDSNGGFGGMSVSDLAACFAGTDPIGELILRRRYIDKKEKSGFETLHALVVAQLYKTDNLPKTPNMTEPLLNVALDDYIGGHKCKCCGGRGELRIESKIFKCRSPRCRDGRVERKNSERARALDMPALFFRRNYLPPFLIIEEYLTRILPDKENKAFNHVSKLANWAD